MTLSVLGRRSCRARLLTVLALLLVLPGIAFVDATNRVVNGECKCIDGDGGVTNECFNDPVGVDCCSEAVNVDDKCTPPAGVLAWNVGGNCRITCSGSPGSFLKVELDRGVSVKGSSLLSFKDAVVDFNSNASPSVFGSGSLKFSFSRGYFSNTLLSFEDTSTGEVSDSNLDLNEYNNRTNFKVTGTSNVTIKNSILKDAGLGGDFQDREMNDITNETPESTLSLENVKMTIVGTPASQAETAALQLTANMTATIKDSEIERLLIVSGSDGSGYNRIFTMQDFKAGEVVNATASTTGGEFGNLSVTATNSKFNNVTVKTPQFSPGDNTEVLNNFKEVVFSMEPTNGQNPIDSYHPLFQFDSKNFFEDADFEGDKVYFRVRSKNYFKDDTLLNNLKNGVWNWDTADKSKLSKVMTELVVGSSDALDSADHLPDFNGVVEFRETEGGSVSYGVGLGVEKAHRIFPAFFFNEQRKLINHNDPGVGTRGYARIYLCDYVNNDDVRNATIPCRPPLGKTCSEMTIEDDEPPGLGDVNCVVSKGYLDIGFKSDYENGRGLPFDTATQKYYYKVLFKDDDAPTEEPALSANGPFGLDSDTPFARTVGAPCPSDDPDVASYNALTGFYEIKSNWLITNVTIDCPEDTKLELLKDANVVVDTGGKLILNNSQVRQSTSLVPGNQKTGMIQLKSDGVLELKGDTDLSVAVDASANAVFKAVDSDVNEDVSLRMNSIARFDNVTLYGNTVPQQNERNFLKAFDNSILTFDASALNTFNGSVSLSNSAFVDMRESVFEDLTLSTTTPSDFATLNTIKNLSLRGVSTATDFAGWPAPLEQSAVTTSLGVLNAEHVLKGNVNVSGTWTVTAPGKLKRHYPIRVFDGGSPVNGATVRMLNRGNETDGVTPLPEVTGATGADGFVVQADYASKMFARVENANQNGSFTLKAKSPPGLGCKTFSGSFTYKNPGNGFITLNLGPNDPPTVTEVKVTRITGANASCFTDNQVISAAKVDDEGVLVEGFATDDSEVDDYDWKVYYEPLSGGSTLFQTANDSESFTLDKLTGDEDDVYRVELTATDDCGSTRVFNCNVKLVGNERPNVKITTPANDNAYTTADALGDGSPASEEKTLTIEGEDPDDAGAQTGGAWNADTDLMERITSTVKRADGTLVFSASTDNDPGDDDFLGSTPQLPGTPSDEHDFTFTWNHFTSCAPNGCYGDYLVEVVATDEFGTSSVSSVFGVAPDTCGEDSVGNADSEANCIRKLFANHKPIAQVSIQPSDADSDYCGTGLDPDPLDLNGNVGDDGGKITDEEQVEVFIEPLPGFSFDDSGFWDDCTGGEVLGETCCDDIDNDSCWLPVTSLKEFNGDPASGDGCGRGDRCVWGFNFSDDPANESCDPLDQGATCGTKNGHSYKAYVRATETGETVNLSSCNAGDCNSRDFSINCAPTALVCDTKVLANNDLEIYAVAFDATIAGVPDLEHTYWCIDTPTQECDLEDEEVWNEEAFNAAQQHETCGDGPCDQANPGNCTFTATFEDYRRLPSGSYEACARAIDSKDAIGGAPEGLDNCLGFNVTQLNRDPVARLPQILLKWESSTNSAKTNVDGWKDSFDLDGDLESCSSWIVSKPGTGESKACAGAGDPGNDFLVAPTEIRCKRLGDAESGPAGNDCLLEIEVKNKVTVYALELKVVDAQGNESEPVSREIKATEPIQVGVAPEMPLWLALLTAALVALHLFLPRKRKSARGKR